MPNDEGLERAQYSLGTSNAVSPFDIFSGDAKQQGPVSSLDHKYKDELAMCLEERALNNINKKVWK